MNLPRYFVTPRDSDKNSQFCMAILTKIVIETFFYEMWTVRIQYIIEKCVKLSKFCWPIASCLLLFVYNILSLVFSLSACYSCLLSPVFSLSVYYSCLLSLVFSLSAYYSCLLSLVFSLSACYSCLLSLVFSLSAYITLVYCRLSLVSRPITLVYCRLSL